MKAGFAAVGTRAEIGSAVGIKSTSSIAIVDGGSAKKELETLVKEMTSEKKEEKKAEAKEEAAPERIWRRVFECHRGADFYRVPHDQQSLVRGVLRRLRYAPVLRWLPRTIDCRAPSKNR